MDARMVYPTAPFDTQAQHPNVNIPPAHTGAGENVESPGKAMAVLSKVKNKARKLRSRIKKVTGSNTSGTGHGDNVNEHGMRDFNRVPGPHDDKFDDDEAESYDEEEEEDFHKSNKNEFRYEQLRSIGALDNQGDGSEVEVRGGVPVPVRADNTGSYWKRADDGEPISAYKSAGPPGALQATPTEYRNYAADDDIPPKEGVPANRKREAPLEESARSAGNLSAISGPEFKPDMEASDQVYDKPVEPHSKYDASNVSVSGTDISHPESLATSKPSVEESSRTEFKPDIEASNRSYGEPVEPQSKNDVSDVSASGTRVSHPQSLASSNLSAEESSAPPYDKIAVMEEDLSADRKLRVGLPSDEHAESTKGNVLETSAPESDPEGKRSNLFDMELGESQSKDEILGTGGTSASDIDVPYPGDLVKPNPSFGQSSSPTRDKIAVLNKEASPDEKLGLGLSTGEQSGSGKGNLLETAVPEGEELSGNQKGGDPLIPLEAADELVYRPVSESEEGSSLTSPPGILEGAVYGRSTDLQESGAGSPFQDKGARLSEMRSDEDLPTSEVDPTASKAEDDIPSNYGEQKRSFDVASEVFDTAGDGSSENWGKWSADKINNAENVTVSSLVASDLRNDGENQDYSGNKSVDAIGTTDKVPDNVPESKNVDTVKPPAGEDVNQDSEEEYYDPNEVKDDQFEQGFALGNAEEDALSGTLAGSAIETLQGLKDTFQSSIGYSNRDTSDVGGEGKPDPVEGEVKTISPSSSQQQQKGGFVQGLRQSVASSLGYGKTGPEEEVVQDTDVLERGESDVEGKDKSGPIEGQERTLSPSSSQQQQKGGFVQGLRQSVASSLGYGKTGPEEEVVQDTDVMERRDSDVGGEGERGPVEGEERTLSPSSSQQQQKGGFVQGLSHSVASSLGYGKTDPEEVGQDAHILERAVEPETEFDSSREPAGGTEQVEEKVHSPSSPQPLSPAGSSQQQQKGGLVQGLTQAVASSLGYGKGGSTEESGQITDALERGRESETGIGRRQQQPHGAENLEERVLSPSGSQEHQAGGFVKDLKETAASPLGYGEAASDKVGNNNGVLERGGEQVEKARSPSGSQLLSPGSSQQQQKGGFIQGLKQTVASSLGYGKGVPGEGVDQTDSTDSLERGRGLETDLDRGRELETDFDSRQQPPVGSGESEGRDFSPSGSQEHEKGGFVEELKQKAASPLGYDEAGSDNAGDNNDVLEKGGISETDFDSGRQQSPGTYEALKNTLASKLGYGVASGEQSPTVKTKTESREQSAELERSELPHDEEGETKESDIKPGLVLNDVKENAGKEEEIPEPSPRSPESGTKSGLVLNDAKETPQRVEEIPEPSPRSGGILQGLKDRFTSTLGYSSQPAETHRETSHTEPKPEVMPEPEPVPEPHAEPEPEPVSVPVSSPGADVPPSSYTQKLMGTTAGARNYLASKIGYGSSNEEVGKNIGHGHDGDEIASPSPRPSPHGDSIHNE